MQTWITHTDYRTSASNLDNKMLGAQIYEGIHVLSSLLNVNDKLVNPKRSVINHPVAKFWKGYECDLYCYVFYHIEEWMNGRGYRTEINMKNLDIILDKLNKLIEIEGGCIIVEQNPKINEDLIKLHKQVLVNKKPEYYKEKWRI